MRTTVYSQNNLALSDLIKTTFSDTEYPAWLPGKASWSVEKGGKGVSTSFDNGAFPALGKFLGSTEGMEREMLASLLPKVLRPKSRKDVE